MTAILCRSLTSTPFLVPETWITAPVSSIDFSSRIPRQNLIRVRHRNATQENYLRADFSKCSHFAARREPRDPKGQIRVYELDISTGREIAQSVGLKSINKFIQEWVMSVYTCAGELGDPKCTLATIQCCYCVYVRLEYETPSPVPIHFSGVPLIWRHQQRYTGFECENTYDDQGNPRQPTNPTKRAISAISERQFTTGQGYLATGDEGSEQEKGVELTDNTIAMPLGDENQAPVEGSKPQQKSKPKQPPVEQKPDIGYHCTADYLTGQGVTPRPPRPRPFRVGPQISSPIEDDGSGNDDIWMKKSLELFHRYFDKLVFISRFFGQYCRKLYCPNCLRWFCPDLLHSTSTVRFLSLWDFPFLSSPAE